MKNFVNIAPADKNPLVIDANDLSVVTQSRQKENKEGEETTFLTFSSMDKSAFLSFTAEKRGIDPDQAIGTLTAAGASLFTIPYVWGDSTPLGRVFVNPSTFNYIITSKPSKEAGDTEESVAILLGVDGYGLVESYKVPVSTVDSFMALVRAEHPDLIRVSPDQAIARFVHPGHVEYDPARLIRIQPNGYDLELIFANGGGIDFHLPRTQWSQRFLDSKFNKATDAKKAYWGTPEKFPELERRLYAFEKNIQERVRREFARAAAKDAPQLIKVENCKGPLYLTFDNVAWISRRGETIAFQFGSKDRRDYGDTRHARFSSEEKAEAELKRLMQMKL